MDTNILEDEGIFITIAFQRNADRDRAWIFIIEDVENCLFKSGSFLDYKKCKIEAFKKAVEYLPK